jgi:hypothetical protein
MSLYACMGFCLCAYVIFAAIQLIQNEQSPCRQFSFVEIKSKRKTCSLFSFRCLFWLFRLLVVYFVCLVGIGAFVCTVNISAALHPTCRLFR